MENAACTPRSAAIREGAVWTGTDRTVEKAAGEINGSAIRLGGRFFFHALTDPQKVIYLTFPINNLPGNSPAVSL
jgi:hypothetical protein